MCCSDILKTRPFFGESFLHTLDPDIHFNRDGWQHVIETQSKLFNLSALVAISDQLREEFHCGHAAGRRMPEIKQTDWRSDLLIRYNDREIGYDLPCLLSASRPTRGRIMICAQDPLRSGTSPALTVGTFFGIDNNGYRHSNRHYGAVWNLIRTCVQAGYDVWVTDALKIFVGRHQLWKDPDLVELCREILRDEIEAFSPDKILAMGGTASGVLANAGLGRSFLRATHPSYYGKKGWYLKGTSDPEEGYLKGLERYYCRILFGADAPPDVAGI